MTSAPASVLRLYGGAEQRRRNGGLALVVLATPLLLYWVYPKAARFAAGEPVFKYGLGLTDLILVGLFALAVWNCWRIRAHPGDYIE